MILLLAKKRISNTPILKIEKTIFLDKDNFIVKYRNEFGDFKTYVVNLKQRTEQELEYQKQKTGLSQNKDLKKFEGYFLSDGIKDFFVNVDENKIFYTTFFNENREKDGKIYGILYDLEKNSEKEIFSSELTEINASYNNKDKIFISTKNSGTTNSISFYLDIKLKDFRQISRAEYGLSGIPNHDFSKILYSKKNEDDEYVLIVKDLENKKETKYDYSTFAEKCVWSKNNIEFFCAVPRYMDKKNTQPDDWYKGKNYFTDNIYKINTEDESVVSVFSATLEVSKFDIVDLKLDNAERYLYWIDKKTDFAWSYDLYY